MKTIPHYLLSWLWVVITLGCVGFMYVEIDNGIRYHFNPVLQPEIVLRDGLTITGSALLAAVAVFGNMRMSGAALIVGAVPIGLFALLATYVANEFFPLPLLL